MIDSCVRQWKLDLEQPFEAMFGYVCATRWRGLPAVLKISFPDSAAAVEASVLDHWGPSVAPAVLEHDVSMCATLLERVEPGWTSAQLPPESSLLVALELFPRIWQSPPPDLRLPDLQDDCQRWTRRFPELWDRWNRPFARSLVQEAIEISETYSNDIPDAVLLHQDLHAENALRNAAGWRIIDPKPVIGPRAIDLARAVRDRPDAWPKHVPPEVTLRQRIEQAADHTGVESETIRRCGVMHTLAWSMDEHGYSDDAMRMASWFAKCR